MKYVYARPDRDNWQPTVDQCRKEIVALIISGGPFWGTIEGNMFYKFQTVSNTHWKEFWKDVTANGNVG